MPTTKAKTTKTEKRTVRQIMTISVPRSVTKKEIFWAIFEALLFFFVSFALLMNIQDAKWLMVAIDALIIIMIFISNL